MNNKNIGNAIGKKTAFVIAINQIESAVASKAKIKETAANLGLSEMSARKAYLNVTNSGDTRVDRRVKYNDGERHNVFDGRAKLDQYEKNSKNKCLSASAIKFRDISASEMAEAILEVMTEKKKVYEVLLEKKIAPGQYYAALFEIEVYGTLFGKKVLTYNRFNKFAVKDLIHLYKYPNGNLVKKFDLVELSTRMRAANILKNKLKRISMSK